MRGVKPKTDSFMTFFFYNLNFQYKFSKISTNSGEKNYVSISTKTYSAENNSQQMF